MLAITVVLGIAVLVASGFVGWKKRVQIEIWLRGRQLVKHAIFWASMATVYVGLLTLGGYFRHANFLLTVSVVFAVITVAGKKSLNQFGTHDFYQVVQISLLVVAIFSWLWPTIALIATLPFVFALVWVLNVMPDRWPEFAGTWGRWTVYRSVQLIAVVGVSWSIFKFTFPELAVALGQGARNAEHAVATWVKNPSFGSNSEPKRVVSPASVPASQANIANSQAVVKSLPKGRKMTADELKNLYANVAQDNLLVTSKPPTVAEVVAANPSGRMPPPSVAPQTGKRKKSVKVVDVLRELEAEFPD